MSAVDRLAEIEARVTASRADAWVDASKDLPAAIAALRAVLDLHLPASGAVWCTCGLLYPCDTFRAIEETLA